ncbi:hypothetical protein Tco_0835489, partial [Tanacetum coccineum]
QHETQTDPSPRPSPTIHIPDSISEVLSGIMKSVSQKGGNLTKYVTTVHKDPAFDELADDTIDYMETEDAQDVGRTSYMVHEEEESAENGVSTEDALSTTQPKVSTDKKKVSTDKEKVSTDKKEVSTDRPDKVLYHNGVRSKEKLKENEKGVDLRDVEETGAVIGLLQQDLLYTLKPLPTEKKSLADDRMKRWPERCKRIEKQKKK